MTFALASKNASPAAIFPTMVPDIIA